jgi:hypothetical protein
MTMVKKQNTESVLRKVACLLLLGCGSACFASDEKQPSDASTTSSVNMTMQRLDRNSVSIVLEGPSQKQELVVTPKKATVSVDGKAVDSFGDSRVSQKKIFNYFSSCIRAGGATAEKKVTIRDIQNLGEGSQNHILSMCYEAAERKIQYPENGAQWYFYSNNPFVPGCFDSFQPSKKNNE